MFCFADIARVPAGAGSEVCRLVLAAGLVTFCAVPAAYGQPGDGDTASPNARNQLEEVVVRAHPLSAEGMAQAATVLEGQALDRRRAATIGETLSQEPGVHSASFGQAVSRPVIHGLGGPRVRVMEDRIDALDVSVTSADHAVSVDPFIADRIEVLKGASTLLYGAGAIGGVVDVHTGRIPHETGDDRVGGFRGGFESRYNPNNEGVSHAFKADGSQGRLAWHADGSFRDGNDYEFPGRAEVEVDDDEPPVRGTLPGSAFEHRAGALGLSWVDDWGFAGFSVSRTLGEYGLPGGHGHGHDEDHEDGHEDEEHDEDDHHDEDEHESEEEGNPLLVLAQTRIDFEAGIEDPFGPFSSLNLRFGHNDYTHREIEPDGAVATLFTNEAWEARAELIYEGSATDGVVGLQFTDRDFSASGEESFVPPVRSRDMGVFLLGERDFGGLTVEGGARLGRTSHESATGESQRFVSWAASAGLLWPLGDFELRLLADATSRAPNSEELYSNGAHLATQSFEIGDPDLDSEQAVNVAATFSYVRERWDLESTLYVTRFSDFIYQQALGFERDELPVFQYQQDGARFHGMDLSLRTRLLEFSEGSLQLVGRMDIVKGRLTDGASRNLPRIPPLRGGIGLDFSYRGFSALLEYTRVAQQDSVAVLEQPTDAYNDVRLFAELQWRAASIFLSGRNLGDSEQRHHASFVKDFVPAPGRTIEMGIRVELN